MLMFNGEFEIDASYILKMKFDQYFCKNTFQWIKRRKKIWAKAVSMFGGVFHSGSAVQIVKYTSSWSKMVPMIFHLLNKGIWSYIWKFWRVQISNQSLFKGNGIWEFCGRKWKGLSRYEWQDVIELSHNVKILITQL